jgi:hypothetical protein
LRLYFLGLANCHALACNTLFSVDLKVPDYGRRALVPSQIVRRGEELCVSRLQIEHWLSAVQVLENPTDSKLGGPHSRLQCLWRCVASTLSMDESLPQRLRRWIKRPYASFLSPACGGTNMPQIACRIDRLPRAACSILFEDARIHTGSNSPPFAPGGRLHGHTPSFWCAMRIGSRC